MGSQGRLAGTAIGLTFALLTGGGAVASPNTRDHAQVEPQTKEQLEAQKAPAGCRNASDSFGAIPDAIVERCMNAPKGADVPSLLPDATRGPILVQEVSTNTVRTTSVAGIATLTSFGALVPTAATDFPADFARLPTDPTQRVYQITSAGAVSRYNAAGVNTVLTPIPPAADATWSDTATDPTSGIVYAAAIVGSCVSSTLSRLDLIAGTSVAVGPITGGGCIISLAADNAGHLWGIDIVGDTLVSIDKVTGAGTVVGAIGFDANYGQAMDCDPASGTCYMFTINVGATANTTELRSVNTATGATTLVGNIGSTAPGGSPQVAGAVFATIADTCAIDADCQDGSLCSGVEHCVSAACTPGTPVTCSDGLFCTTDTCTPTTGVCSFPPNLCSDGDVCTVDICNEAGGVCNHANAAVAFCNAGSIAIPSSGAGAPYPSTIAVSGLVPSAKLCSVQLQAISHTWPGDIDILLVGPVATSQNAEIMSDVGANFGLVGVSLTLKDSAAASLPVAAQIVSGTYRPTNAEGADTFPAPAPVTLGGSALTAFDGNPNGTWSLYVADDTSEESGTIAGGWCVSIVPTCTTNADCNDGKPCTDDVCTNAVCTYTNNTAACTDGNACTQNDLCSGGVCVSGPPRVCDDGNVCTSNTCNTGTGQCVYPAIICNDANICTDDTCNPATGCVYTANQSACNDNNLCTMPDLCQNGACVGQIPAACTPDGNVCTTDTAACNPATGFCAFTNNTNPCNDGNACTTGDTCGPGPLTGIVYETFDGVPAPGLPPGWTTSLTGSGSPWTTVSTSSDTPPNSAFGFDGAAVADEVLVSPPINIVSTTARVSFQNRWSFEGVTSCFDAGVLEIKIGAGAFTDIVTAGGSFSSGGYTGIVSPSFGNPLASRAAWCNASAGYPAYLTTVVSLPLAAAGQTIQLRWRVGTDGSTGGVGQNIDSIVLFDGPNVCKPGAGTIVCNDSNPCTADSCSPTSGCIFAPIPAPPETQSFVAAADEVTFSWDPQASATRYDVVRGLVSALPVGPGGGDEFCFDNLLLPTLTDATLPGPGAAFWYLSRGENTCGNGTYGNRGVSGVPGAPRVTTTCP